VLVLFAIAYAAALAILAIGTFGLFGQPRDPLSGVFVAMLGMSWNRLLGGAPEPLLPWLAIVAPALNMLILWALCFLRRERRAASRVGQRP
jgi:hypothetical protein